MLTAEVAQKVDKLDPAMRAAMLARARWLAMARPKQVPAGDWWHTWLALAGRGFGKTRACGEDAWWYCATNPGVRYAAVAATSSDLRKTIFEGESGLRAITPAGVLRGGSFDKAYNRTHFELNFANGSIIQGFSADAPERLRGPQFHRAWCDELAAWATTEAWDMLQFTLRLGDDPRVIIATTPKPKLLIRQLVKDAGRDVRLVSGSTYENAANLARPFLKKLESKYAGTRLGRQELDAVLLEDDPAALWKRAWFDDRRVAVPPLDLRAVVVAVDPAVTDAEGSDETGLIVAGKDREGRGYTLADRTRKCSPDEWARAAVIAYDEFNADAIVAEVNNGGDLVESTIRVAAQALKAEGKRRHAEVVVRQVRASRGKAIRAEPVAALYEQGRISHVGPQTALEDQMCQFTPDFDRKLMGYSPDRLDAAVWAYTALFLGELEAPVQAPVVAATDSYWRR